MRNDKKHVLVVGATSSLAEAICHKLAKSGHALTLAGRDEEEVRLLASDLTTRFEASCTPLIADLLDADFSPEAFIEQAGDFDQMIMAVGDLGGSEVTDSGNIAYTIYINYTVPAQIATAAALRLSEKHNGTIVLISSITGDRGRARNYPYGSAKAALSTFASGLRHRFRTLGVHVVTVKPGPIDTPMTWGTKAPFIASREDAAEDIIDAMERKKNVVYVPGFWWLIMVFIHHIPESIFKRLSL